jgi:hypothetical protein
VETDKELGVVVDGGSNEASVVEVADGDLEGGAVVGEEGAVDLAEGAIKGHIGADK